MIPKSDRDAEDTAEDGLGSGYPLSQPTTVYSESDRREFSRAAGSGAQRKCDWTHAFIISVEYDRFLFGPKVVWNFKLKVVPPQNAVRHWAHLLNRIRCYWQKIIIREAKLQDYSKPGLRLSWFLNQLRF